MQISQCLNKYCDAQILKDGISCVCCRMRDKNVAHCATMEGFSPLFTPGRAV